MSIDDMASNGRLSSSELRSITGGRLRKDAAASWNDMRAYIGRKTGVWIRPLGSASSYRTYSQQRYFWNLYKSGRGNVAAYPGTSNHGWGLAVDVANTSMAAQIRRHGGRFGWSWDEGRRVGEWWHFRYVGGYSSGGSSPSGDTRPTLKLGHKGAKVRQAQRLLTAKGFASVQVDGVFGPTTASAVRRLHRAYGHEGHSHIGAAMWKILLNEHPWRVLMTEEREKLATLEEERRIARRHGGWDKVDASHLNTAVEAKNWLIQQRKTIWRAAKGRLKGARSGWNVYNRRRRYDIILEHTKD